MFTFLDIFLKSQALISELGSKIIAVESKHFFQSILRIEIIIIAIIIYYHYY